MSRIDELACAVVEILKSVRGSERAGHKYIRRVAKPGGGDYRYYYRMPLLGEGMPKHEPDEPVSEATQQKDRIMLHGHRRLLRLAKRMSDIDNTSGWQRALTLGSWDFSAKSDFSADALRSLCSGADEVTGLTQDALKNPSMVCSAIGHGPHSGSGFLGYSGRDVSLLDISFDGGDTSTPYALIVSSYSEGYAVRLAELDSDVEDAVLAMQCREQEDQRKYEANERRAGKQNEP